MSARSFHYLLRFVSQPSVYSAGTCQDPALADILGLDWTWLRPKQTTTSYIPCVISELDHMSTANKKLLYYLARGYEILKPDHWLSSNAYGTC